MALALPEALQADTYLKRESEIASKLSSGWIIGAEAVELFGQSHQEERIKEEDDDDDVIEIEDAECTGEETGGWCYEDRILDEELYGIKSESIFARFWAWFVSTMSPKLPQPDCCACLALPPTQDFSNGHGEKAAVGEPWTPFDPLSGAVNCLEHCGFAVLQKSFDANVLDNVRQSFDNWISGSSDDICRADGLCTSPVPDPVRVYTDVEGGLRGSRKEYVLPFWPPFNSDSVIYNRDIVAVVSEYSARKAAKSFWNWFLSPLPTLEMASIIHSPVGTVNQDWHRDSIFADGIKVQVPLVDVSDEMGPVELRPSNSARNPKCSIVRATSELGTAIVYIHRLKHHGTANLSNRSRPVLDFSYMSPKSAEEYSYIKTFRKIAKSSMASINQRFVELCRHDGARCSSFSPGP